MGQRHRLSRSFWSYNRRAVLTRSPVGPGRAAAMPATSPCQTYVRAFLDQFPFELGQRPEQVEHQPATRRGGVDGLGQRPEPDAAGLQMGSKSTTWTSGSATSTPRPIPTRSSSPHPLSGRCDHRPAGRPRRFKHLAAVRAYSGLVPRTNQSSWHQPTRPDQGMATRCCGPRSTPSPTVPGRSTRSWRPRTSG